MKIEDPEKLQRQIADEVNRQLTRIRIVVVPVVATLAAMGLLVVRLLFPPSNIPGW